MAILDEIDRALIEDLTFFDHFTKYYPNFVEAEGRAAQAASEAVEITQLCPDCKGTGKITLFTSIRTCRCQEK